MNRKIKTVIMAGGMGSRIQSIYSSVPKPLIPINGKPILQHEIECLVSQGFRELIITVSYMADKIENYFDDGSKFDCKISYFKESIPLGNAGALFKMWESGILQENCDFILINADSMFDIDFGRFLDFHMAHKGALASLFVHPNNHPYDSGLIVLSDNDSETVNKWIAKEDMRPKYYKNRVNAGIHILNTNIFKAVNIEISKIGATDEQGKVCKVDLDRHILKPLAGTGKLVAYNSPEYVKDMGTPERLEQVRKDLKTGKIHSRNLNNPQKAVFLDRDGTINKFKGFIKKPDQFELLPYVAEAIKKINESDYLCIVVTNQPVIARGEATINQLNEIHNKLETLLGEEGAYIDALYYCPHHPDRGFVGEIKELKKPCNCRKPNPGLLFKAAKDYNIDLNNSWIIGDSWRDIQAGINAGTKTILLKEEGIDSDERENNSIEYNELVVASDLLHAVDYIIE